MRACKAGPSIRRRRLLQAAAATASLLGHATHVAATTSAVAPVQADDLFVAPTLAELIVALGGAPQPSPLVSLDVPAVADDGAVVPVTVSSALPATQEILLLVERNPQPLALRFEVPAGTEAFVATRIRMAASGTVVAVVRAAHGLYGASRSVEVTLGGCG